MQHSEWRVRKQREKRKIGVQAAYIELRMPPFEYGGIKVMGIDLKVLATDKLASAAAVELTPSALEYVFHATQSNAADAGAEPPPKRTRSELADTDFGRTGTVQWYATKGAYVAKSVDPSVASNYITSRPSDVNDPMALRHARARAESWTIGEALSPSDDDESMSPKDGSNLGAHDYDEDAEDINIDEQVCDSTGNACDVVAGDDDVGVKHDLVSEVDVQARYHRCRGAVPIPACNLRQTPLTRFFEKVTCA